MRNNLLSRHPLREKSGIEIHVVAMTIAHSSTLRSLHVISVFSITTTVRLSNGKHGVHGNPVCTKEKSQLEELKLSYMFFFI